MPGSKAYGATIRLGGIVQRGTVAWDAGHTELSFRVAERHDAHRQECPGQGARNAPADVPRGDWRRRRRHLRQVAGVHLQPPHGEPLQRVPASQTGRGGQLEEHPVLRHHVRGEAKVRGTLGYAFVLGGLLCAIFGAVVGIEGGLRRRPATRLSVDRATTGFFLCMLGSQPHHGVGAGGARLQRPLRVPGGKPQHATRLHRGVAVECTGRQHPLLGRHPRGVPLRLLPGAARLPAPAMSSWRSARCWGRPPSSPSSSPARPTPSARSPPCHPTARGPTRCLQNHILMVIHPPMLYCGYVGMTVPFGIAVAALLDGQPRRGLGQRPAPLDAGGVDLSHGGHHPRLLVGLRRARLGRLLGLGPGGERLVPPLVDGHRLPALHHAAGASPRPRPVDHVLGAGQLRCSPSSAPS